MTPPVFRSLESVQELTSYVHDTQTLLLKLKKELAKYSVFDLMNILAYLEQENRYLPPNYKKIFKAKMSEQLFSNYRAILSAQDPQNHDLDMEQYRDFMEGFQKRLADPKVEDTPQMMVLYNLCAIYNLFISQTPPHPEGTPFPGGFAIEKIDQEYYCPVKDKQMDNDEALCRFCVARQSDI